MKAILALSLVCAFANAYATSPAKYLDWAGLRWQVREGGGAPCATDRWNPQGVWVDARGWLHLKLSRLPSGQFACTELWAVNSTAAIEPMGYGSYEFDVSGPLGAIDRHVVLGMFMYPLPENGPDETNELDIEISRWGKSTRNPLNYTAWYASRKGRATQTFPIGDEVTEASFSMDWKPGHVDFQSTVPPRRSVTFTDDIAIKPQRLTINLWLFRSEAPADGKEVEFVIKSLRRSF
jgi:hypothetical protein